ncbi:MAG: hypothetical protein AAF443_03295 [Chlamydiota bacterium]
MAKANHTQKVFQLPGNDLTAQKESKGIPEADPLAPNLVEKQKSDFLGNLLLKKGELCLLNKDLSGLYFFEMASRLDPENAALCYQQGLALLEYGSEKGKEEGLKLACKSFKKASSLNPHLFDAWHQWGYTLYLLGVRKKEPAYFFHAQQKYNRALALKENQNVDSIADLYENYGDIWVLIAQKSSEPADLCSALNAYDTATTYREQNTFSFWVRYGNAALKVAKQTSQTKFLLKAIGCYKNALTLSASSATGWQCLGQAIHALYLSTFDDDHYNQANECFALAAQLSSKSPGLWYQWASLLFDAGLSLQDSSKLRICIEKCHRGIQIESNQLPLITLWAQALAKLGALTEALPLIEEAHNKTQELEANGGTQKDVFYLEGIIAMARGSYFQDPDYYYQASEKFQELLSQDRTDHSLWHAMAQSFLAAAQLDGDSSSFQCACRFFKRAIDLNSKLNYHYDYGLCLTKYGELLQDTQLVEQAVNQLQYAIKHQQNAAYVYPNWLFEYAYALDLMGDLTENESYYIKALEISLHILSLEPKFPGIHHQLALIHSHYAQLISSLDFFNRAFHHYQIAYRQDKENDQMILDWAITLANCGDTCAESFEQATHYLQKAEYKMIQAIRLGNTHSYYSLGCLYSLMGNYEQAFKLLEKAHYFEGLPPIEEILEDDWLENLREKPRFRLFVDRLKDKVNE